MVRVKNGHLGAHGLVEQFDLAIQPNEQDRQPFGPQQGDRIGSNVMASAGTSSASALARSRASSLWWPRCTPSKIADRDEKPLEPRGKLTNVVDRDHRHFAPLPKPAALSDWPERP